MKHWLWVLIIIIVSCNKKTKVPRGILPKDTMQNVLKEMIMVDEFVTGYVAKDSTKNQKQERLSRYEQVFALHNISEATFKKSLEFYREKPYLMKAIFDSLASANNRPDMFNVKPVEHFNFGKLDTTKYYHEYPLWPFMPDTMMMRKMKFLRNYY